MPPGPCQTASWFRGKNGWFNEREEKIIVNRVIREDPGKSSMHNREPVTPRLLWQSLKDYDLWLVQAFQEKPKIVLANNKIQQADLYTWTCIPNPRHAACKLSYSCAEGTRL